MRLILASESPRRRELLRWCGIECEALPVGIDEEPRAGEAPEGTARRLAREKARAALEKLDDRKAWVLAADTVVACGSRVLGKPRNRKQAEEYLRLLRGREHRVITGVCLLRSPGVVESVDTAMTGVRMRNYSPAEMSAYIESGDALDKAGAYAIQHPSFRPVESIDGCYTNVVGLPLCRVCKMLESAGWKPDLPLPEACRAGRECGFSPQATRNQGE
jgi:septum formation protein